MYINWPVKVNVFMLIMLQVLRFSRLFGPGKPSSLPQIWRSVRKRRRRRKQHHLDHSDSGSDQDNQWDKRRGWTFNFAPPPTADMCASDDEVIVRSMIQLRI
jgi:transcription initiation factor TFIID subunit 1